MHKRIALALLLTSLAGTSLACTCMRPEDEAADRQRQWADAQVVVLAEVVGESSEPSTRWFSRNHVLGHDSPLRRRALLHLVVKHRWKGELTETSAFVVEKVDGSLCGYESWGQSRQHLLYLSRAGHWRAGLCGLSHPAPDATEAIQAMDAELASRLAERPAAR
ncbi:hypothetical protein ACS5PN_02765 [Roseateles sp. NT4]|uniref:hypothetical protein n=1 Tax=Roseateles sp. NT4 TaxID=3453715 RepID=UPI003EEA0D6E